MGRMGLGLVVGGMLATLGAKAIHPQTLAYIDCCIVAQAAGIGLLMSSFGLFMDWKRDQASGRPGGAGFAPIVKTPRAPLVRRAPFRKSIK